MGGAGAAYHGLGADVRMELLDRLLELSDALSDPTMTVIELPDGVEVDAEFNALFSDTAARPRLSCVPSTRDG